MPVALTPLPGVSEQADRLIGLGIHELVGLSATQVRTAAASTDARNALLVVHSARVSHSTLAPFLEHSGKPGFVVQDMADVDQFTPIDIAAPPSSVLYLLHEIGRGDEMANWSADEALLPSLPLIARRSRWSKASTGCSSSLRL